MIIINDDIDEDYGNDRIQMLIEVTILIRIISNGRIKIIITINIMTTL